jgi:hypothetical protein
MADAPYLIALALLEQNGTRAMPLQGKSLREPIAEAGDPGEAGRHQVLELLVRVWQRSDTGPLQRAGGSNSLLLAEVPIEALQVQLPQLKANWLNSGDGATLLKELAQMSYSLWRVSQEPRSTLVFERLP